MLLLLFAALLRLKRARNQNTLPNELQQAILDVRNIGTAQQFIKLGHLYAKQGKPQDALAVYYQALIKEPNNIEALRASAAIELKNDNLYQESVLLRR